MAHERLDTRGEGRLRGLLEVGDPYGEVRMAWHAKETVRDVYEIDNPALAAQYTRRLAQDLQDGSCPPEVNKLGRTLERWHTQIVNWHHARYTNAATEAINNLIKRIKRIGFGHRQLHQLPDTSPPLRRETQLGPTPRSHSPLKSDEPLFL